MSDVFAYVTDPEKLPTWQTNTISATAENAGPLALGSRLREVHRAPGGKQLESVVQVAAYEPDRAFALEVVEGMSVHAQMTFEPTDGGTLFRFRAHGRLPGAMRLAQPLLRVTLRRQFTRHCTTLKRMLEREQATTAET